MPETHHNIDQDAALVAAQLPMHIQGESEDNCPLCAFLRLLQRAREMEQWRFAAEHDVVVHGEPTDLTDRDARQVAQLLHYAAHRGQD